MGCLSEIADAGCYAECAAGEEAGCRYHFDLS